MRRAAAIDPRLVALAGAISTQFGLFTRQQAMTAGFSYDAIVRRVQRGEWLQVAPGVFRAVPNATITSAQATWALVKSSKGVSARRSALALVGLVPFPTKAEVIVPRSRRNLERDVLMSTRSLPDDDIVVVRGIKSVTATRGVIDTCGALLPTLQKRLVTKAVVRRLVTPEGLVQRAEELRNPRRPGALRVIKIVEGLNDSLRDARNEWAALVLEHSDRLGLPRPVANFRVDLPTGTRYIDAAWDGFYVGGEFDGYYEHLVSRKRFDDDRTRRNELQDADWKIFNLTSTMLKQDPDRAFRPIVNAIRRAASTRGPCFSGLCP